MQNFDHICIFFWEEVHGFHKVLKQVKYQYEHGIF